LFADIDRLEASLGAVDASDDEEASSPSSDDEAGSSETVGHLGNICSSTSLIYLAVQQRDIRLRK